jgi:hypothetical protein
MAAGSSPVIAVGQIRVRSAPGRRRKRQIVEKKPTTDRCDSLHQRSSEDGE